MLLTESVNRRWPPSGTPMQTSPDAVISHFLGRTNRTLEVRSLRRYCYRPVMDVTKVTFVVTTQSRLIHIRTIRSVNLANPRCSGEVKQRRSGRIPHRARAEISDSDDPDQGHNCGQY